jgi:cytochrome P450
MADGGITDYSEVNFFTDPQVAHDPYPYYEYLRGQCPVAHVPSSGVVAVTGYDELVAVYRDSATFSAVNSSLGPFPLPFDVTGVDISDDLEATVIAFQ